MTAATKPSRCQVARDASEVCSVRRWVRATLASWRLEGTSDDAADDTGVIVSELVTNAIVHGDGAIEVTLSYSNGVLRCEVRDEGAGRPQWPYASADPTRGRGLRVVDGLVRQRSGSWGVDTAKAGEGDGTGKTVWVAVPIVRGWGAVS